MPTEKRKHNKGIAIESAMGFMVVIFALCSIIITFSLSMRSKSKKTTDEVSLGFSVDQIGENFVQGLHSGQLGTESESQTPGSATPGKGNWEKLSGINYGVRIDGDDTKGIYTLRLVNWDKIPENGSYNGLYDLIVTAQLIGNNNNVKVINWSTNENKNSLIIAGKDVAEFMDVEATPEHYKDTYVHNFVGSYRYTPTVTNKR